MKTKQRKKEIEYYIEYYKRQRSKLGNLADCLSCGFYDKEITKLEKELKEYVCN